MCGREPLSDAFSGAAVECWREVRCLEGAEDAVFGRGVDGIVGMGFGVVVAPGLRQLVEHAVNLGHVGASNHGWW